MKPSGFFTTTLNAPLTCDEYKQMEDALIATKNFARGIQLGMPPEEILKAMTKLIDFCFKTRDAIQSGWNHANSRHLAATAKRPLGGARSKPAETNDIVKKLLSDKDTLMAALEALSKETVK